MTKNNFCNGSEDLRDAFILNPFISELYTHKNTQSDILAARDKGSEMHLN